MDMDNGLDSHTYALHSLPLLSPVRAPPLMCTPTYLPTRHNSYSVLFAGFIRLESASQVAATFAMLSRVLPLKILAQLRDDDVWWLEDQGYGSEDKFRNAKIKDFDKMAVTAQMRRAFMSGEV